MRTNAGQKIALIYDEIKRCSRRYAHLDPDDLAHDVVLRLLQKGDSIPEQPHKAWIAAVVHNVAVDKYRMTNREIKFLDRTVEVRTTDRTAADEDQALLFAIQQPAFDEIDLLPAILDALSKLSVQHRQVLLLHMAGFSYMEIAERTGADIGTVRSRLYYARKYAQSSLAGFR